ncbi:hypothetical protein RDI58_015451 [Solanum bulbocastanum]|uniref:DUF7081 domain-containing protein n=1 Tax=Solanum bulbocastanum TaxID=147425 RepID=A0AAN8YCV7_SOLBU
MSAKEEVEESRALVEYNGSASRINDIGLQVYPVSEYDSGEGLPYSPVDWPNAGDKWGWRAGKKATGLGTYKDKYLHLPKRFQALKDGKKYVFRSKISVKKYLQSEYLDIDFDSDMKERSTTSSGTKMQSLLADSPIRAITLSLVFAKTVVVSFAVNLSVWTMMVGGSISLDARYLC